jgi:hypothetical protein
MVSEEPTSSHGEPGSTININKAPAMAAQPWWKRQPEIVGCASDR